MTSLAPKLKSSDNLGDKRLSSRYTKIIGQLSENIVGSIPQAAQNKRETKAFYRFLHNKKVNEHKLISEQIDELLLTEDIHKSDRLLSISDSVELDYTNKKSAENLGPLTYKKRRGMILHNNMIATDRGLPCGLLSQSYIVRSDKDFGKSNKKNHLPIEEKESIKWLNDFKKAQDLCNELNKEVVFVADREADMMDLFHAKKHDLMHYVIRSQFNRCLKNSTQKLYDVLSEQKEAGRYEIDLINPTTLKKYKAILAVRFCSVVVKLSGNLKCNKHLTPIQVNAIEVKQINSVDGVEKMVNWKLLTSLPINDLSSVRTIIQYYVLRWIIERFHYVMKSGGANVEQLQIEKPQPLKNTITSYSIAIMKVFKIKYLAQNNPDLNIYEAGVSKKEHLVLYKYAKAKGLHSVGFNEKDPPSIYEYCITLGKIGGFIPSKRQPLPGLKILTRAQEKFSNLLDFYDTNISKN